MSELDWSGMPIHEAIKADWKTPELLIEGSLGCAKTTVFLDKEIDALLKWPGIPILLFRWTDDAVQTKLRPAFEEIAALRGVSVAWNAKAKRFELENGSVAYMFGLKAVSAIEQYNKIRGLGVSRIGGDQVEEMAQDVAGELRGRLRPDLTATLQGKRFPFQLTFVANPSDGDFWLSKEFPEDNRIKGRKLYSLSIFDNKHLPEESRDSLLRQYPTEHPKNLTMVMGKRGPNITGVPIYEGLYRRDRHQRAVALRPDAPVYEAFEFGKHNPVWIIAQSIYSGGIAFCGGIRGQEMMLDDFLSIVKEQRSKWIHPGMSVKTCMASMGSRSAMQIAGVSWEDALKQAGFKHVQSRDGSNSGDVVLRLIEDMGALLRRRAPSGEEAIAVNDDVSKWLIASRDGLKESPFLHIGFEAGYVWDKSPTSVANKELRQPREDDKFANIMHCAENMLLNFFAGQPSDAERERAELERLKTEAAQRLGFGYAGPDSWMGI